MADSSPQSPKSHRASETGSEGEKSKKRNTDASDSDDSQTPAKKLKKDSPSPSPPSVVPSGTSSDSNEKEQESRKDDVRKCFSPVIEFPPAIKWSALKKITAASKASNIVIGLNRDLGYLATINANLYAAVKAGKPGWETRKHLQQMQSFLGTVDIERIDLAGMEAQWEELQRQIALEKEQGADTEYGDDTGSPDILSGLREQEKNIKQPLAVCRKRIDKLFHSRDDGAEFVRWVRRLRETAPMLIDLLAFDHKAAQKPYKGHSVSHQEVWFV